MFGVYSGRVGLKLGFGNRWLCANLLGVVEIVRFSVIFVGLRTHCGGFIRVRYMCVSVTRCLT